MTTVGLDTELVESSVPVLVGSSVCDRISRLQRAFGAMLLRVED